MNKFRTILLFTAILTCVAILPSRGSAQSGSDVLEEIEEIVVTARKRAEFMQDAPVTITAFSRESLELYNIDQMEDLAYLTPGLFVGEAITPAGAMMSLRGVSTGTGNPAFDNPIAMIMDGVAFNHAGFARTSQFDLRQVEVYKGPQALFYGKNSPGGVIYFQSADPSDEFEASLRVGYEFNADELFAEGIISGPLSDTLRGRLVVFGSDMDGWIDNIAGEAEALGFGAASDRSKLPEREETFIRGTLIFEPSDRLRMRTKISQYNLDGSTYHPVSPLTVCPAGGGFDAGGFPCADQGDFMFEQLLAQEVVDANSRISSRQPFKEEDWFAFSHQIDFDVTDDIQLTSVTGYLDWETLLAFEAAHGPVDVLQAVGSVEKDHFTQELRLTSSFDSSVNFSAGVFYGTGEVTAITEVYFVPAPGAIVTLSPPDPIYPVDTESLSIFGELIWNLSDTLELSAGARWSDESREYKPSEAGVRVPNVVSDLDFTNVSPQVSLTWKPTDTSTYFISYRVGFKSGGHNSTFVLFGIGTPDPAAPFDVSYEEESVNGFELGAKWTLLEERLRVNTAAYRYKYDDMQLSAFEVATLAQKIFNAGKSTIQGAEIDILYLTEIDGLTLNLGVSYNNAEFDEFLGNCYDTQTAAQGCLPKPGFPGVFEQDFSGRTLPFAPEWNAVAGATYVRQISDDWTLSSALTLAYSDSYNPMQTQSPAAEQDSYTRINANLTLSMGDQWEFSLIGANLTEEWVRSVTGGANSNPPGTLVSSIGRGRQISLQAKWTH